MASMLVSRKALTLETTSRAVRVIARLILVTAVAKRPLIAIIAGMEMGTALVAIPIKAMDMDMDTDQ